VNLSLDQILSFVSLAGVAGAFLYLPTKVKELERRVEAAEKKSLTMEISLAEIKVLLQVMEREIGKVSASVAEISNKLDAKVSRSECESNREMIQKKRVLEDC